MADVFAPALALLHRAGDLASGARFVEAAELFYAASRLARQLGGGESENLAVCDLQLCCIMALLENVATGADCGRGLQGNQPFLDTSLKELMENALHALRERLARGTLQAGCCAQQEEAWFKAELDSCIDAPSGEEASAAREALVASTSAFIGVKCAFLGARVAWTAIWTLSLSEEEVHGCMFLLKDLLAMICAAPPRQMILKGELAMLYDLQRFFTEQETEKLRLVVPDVVLMPLQRAHERLQSRIAQMPAAHREMYTSRTQLEIARAEQMLSHVTRRMERQPRTCALASCAAVDSPGKPHRSCAACMNAFYCSREHQREDWPSHKTACKQARKASGAS
jgi:hypothetical protein